MCSSTFDPGLNNLNYKYAATHPNKVTLFFLNKNKLNENTEAEIAQKNKNKLKTD